MKDTSISALLFTLLLKVGVAASFAALLARWNTFRRVLFTEERDPDQKLKLMLFMTPPLIVGVALRMVGFPYRFADLSVEGAFLMGLLGGRVVGPIGGAIITIPALMGHEWLGMPAAATAGLLGGLTVSYTHLDVYKRQRSGCPVNCMPNRSKISRSSQFAPGQTGTMESTTGSLPKRRTRIRIFWRSGMDTR